MKLHCFFLFGDLLLFKIQEGDEGVKKHWSTQKENCALSKNVSKIKAILTLYALYDQNLNSHLLPIFISYRCSGVRLIKYHTNSYCVIMSVILMTTLFLQSIDITRRNLMPITFRA